MRQKKYLKRQQYNYAEKRCLGWHRFVYLRANDLAVN